jgi:hypothetical protein
MRIVCQTSFVILILLLSSLLGQQGAEAVTYYVATTGNDAGGDGSLGNPWQTVPKGIRSLHAGDTLFIRGGTYTIGAVYGNSASDTYGCNPNCPTSWGTATKIMNYPGEAVVIRHFGFNMDNDSYPNGLSYLIWQGDTRANFIHEHIGTGCPYSTSCPGDFAGFRFNNAVHHIRLQTMTVRNFTSMGITWGNSSDCTKRPADIEVIDNEIRNNGNERETPGPYDHGIYPTCGDRGVISRNYVVGNSGYGIHLNKSSTNTRNATMNFTIERNIVEGRSTTGTPGASNTTTAGILITRGSGHIIRNNVIIGKGSQVGRLTVGIMFIGDMSGALVANNTVYDVSGAGGHASGAVANINFVNNIFSQVPTPLDVTGTNITASNNLCHVANVGCSKVTTTPGFVAPGTNFRLATGSVGIDAGATVFVVTNDYDGAARPKGAAYDIGAYEGDGQSTTAPSPPRNLSVR